jgi:hypothetical protein
MYSVKFDNEGYYKGRREILRHITAREYLSELSYSKSKSMTVRKEKISFLFQQRAFAIEKYLNSKEKITILRTEVPEKSSWKLDKDLPSFIKIIKDVTSTKEYSTYSICKRISADSPSA